MRWFVLMSVEMGIRSLVFMIPTVFVAKWCDVQPSWKSWAFMMFCIIWAAIVLDVKDAGRWDDPSATRRRKAATDALTPAQVAAAARQLALAPKSKLGRRT